MAGNGHVLLREARDSVNLTRDQLAFHVGVSRETIHRWESGKNQPTPDDVDRIGEVVKDRTLWHRWMLESEPSYAKRYTGAECLMLPISVMRVRHALADVLEYQEAMERDAMDGKLDDKQLTAAYGDCLRAAIAKLSDAAQHMTGG